MFAVLHISDFSLQAVLRHEPELHAAAVALLQEDSNRALVRETTDLARQFGIIPGMTSTQAKARCENIVFRVRSEAQERTAQDILIECAYSSAAFIESTGPGICTMDLRGLPMMRAEEKAGAQEHWANCVIKRLAEFNLRTQVGIAAAPGLALQAARCAEPFLRITNIKEFQRDLPIESISPPPDLLEVCRKWGITKVASFLALGKEKIAERLGAAGVILFETARADVILPLNLASPGRIYEESFTFEQAIETLEPLLFMVRRLLEQLARRLEQISQVIEELRISLPLDSGEPHERTLKIPSATCDVDVLFRILHNHLETVRTGSPVIGLSLRAKPCASESQQFQLFETAVRDPNRFYETIGRLAALLGPDRVGIPILQQSHRPDDFKMEPATEKRAGISNSVLESGAVPRGLPLRRFRPPVRATVTLRDAQPIFLRCSQFSGPITASRGPWRLSGNWWDDLWSHEEWDVQTKDGGLYRLFRSGTEWFLEGTYD
jgi:protein ImuB